ncbi:MAG: TetR/AcrR family transcriptional regulator [Acidimicrobiales bacterium]|nr:TetR/AcrR family transcriptional regulator [Acidimicrobiales bacterium]
MSSKVTTGPDRGTAGNGAGGAPTGGRRLTADARRRQLFATALRLFAERGYSATTMDDIAEAAGVTKPLLYQHFDSKRALYLELMDVFAGVLVRRIVDATADAEGPRQQVERGFAAYFALMVENEAAFRLLYGREAPADPELSEARRRVEETIAQAIDPLIDAGLDPEHRLLLAHSVVGMAEGAGRHWLERRQSSASGAADGDNGTAAGATMDMDPALEAATLAIRLADLAWAGLRQVHRT